MTQHTFEIAPSGRSKCRGCGDSIAKDSLRFGERLPNPFGDGDMTHWHHPACAAHRRPQPLLEALAELSYPQDDAPQLQAAAAHAVDYPRLQRLGKAERASSGRARCRHCNELIAVDSWRLPLIFFNDDTYATSGFIHAGCARAYCTTTDVWDTIARFAGELDEATRDELQQLCQR